MTTQLERIEYELRLAGYDLKETDINNWENYAQGIGDCAWKICKLFCSQGHSGMSAEFVIELVYKLLKGETLSPLTNNPEEWLDVSYYSGEQMYQSKRKFSCFSDDNLETYYDIDEDCNRNWELDEFGNRTGWSCTKKRSEITRHKLLKEKE